MPKCVHTYFTATSIEDKNKLLVMTELFEKNMRTFDQSRPVLSKRIRSFKAESPAAMRRFPKLTDRIKTHPMIVVVGFSDSADFADLISKRTIHQKVYLFIEPNIANFIQLCHEIDFSELILDPHFLILLSNDDGELRAVFKGIGVQFSAICSNVGLVKCITEPVEERRFQEIIGQFFSTMQITKLWHGTSVDDSVFGFANTVENFEHCLHSHGFDALRGKFDGLTALSIASGPSLNEAIPFLKDKNGKYVIIACDSSVKPLLESGIMPDFVTAIEREEIVTRYFQKASFDPTTTLIAPHVLLKSSFDHFDGIKAIYAHNSGLCKPLGFDFLGSPLATGFSAGNLNISAAIAMGFKKIVMIGHNLGFDADSGASHVDGILNGERSTPKTEKELAERWDIVRIPSQDGTAVVLSEPGYLIYKAQIEDEILLNKDCEFVNTALKGVNIKGARTMRLSEALGTADEHGPRIRDVLRSLVRPLDSTIVRERRRRVRSVCSDSIKSVQQSVRKASSGKKAVIEMRLKLYRSKFNRIVLREAITLIQNLQAVRESMYLQSDSSGLVYSVAKPEIVSVEREISTLNSRIKSENNLILEYLKLAEKAFATFESIGERVMHLMAPLTRESCSVSLSDGKDSLLNEPRANGQ